MQSFQIKPDQVVWSCIVSVVYNALLYQRELFYIVSISLPRLGRGYNTIEYYYYVVLYHPGSPPSGARYNTINMGMIKSPACAGRGIRLEIDHSILEVTIVIPGEIYPLIQAAIHGLTKLVVPDSLRDNVVIFIRLALIARHDDTASAIIALILFQDIPELVPEPQAQAGNRASDGIADGCLHGIVQGFILLALAAPSHWVHIYNNTLANSVKQNFYSDQ